jgi:hypothetical protein
MMDKLILIGVAISVGLNFILGIAAWIYYSRNKDAVRALEISEVAARALHLRLAATDSRLVLVSNLLRQEQKIKGIPTSPEAISPSETDAVVDALNNMEPDELAAVLSELPE